MSDRTDLSIRTTEGIVRRVDLMTRELELLADAGVLRLVVLPGSRVLLNGERVKLRLLQPQDRVAVSYWDAPEIPLAHSVRVLGFPDTASRDEGRYAAHPQPSMTPGAPAAG